MNKKNYLTVAAMTLAVLSSCGGQKEVKNTSGIDLANMDTTVSAGQDFFRYACGGWNEAHPLTAEYSRYGTFDQLAENNQKQLRELIEGLAAQQNEQGTTAQKVGDLYNMAMDSVALNEQGYTPIKPMLDKIAALTDEASLVCIPTRKGDDSASLREAINQAIAELSESGQLSELSEKYFGSDISIQTASLKTSVMSTGNTSASCLRWPVSLRQKRSRRWLM